MKNVFHRISRTASPSALWLALACLAPLAHGEEFLRIDAPELQKLDFSISTGGLPVAPGLETFAVVRSNKEHPEFAEGKGWTFQHHPDIAAWHGRLYVGWNSCQEHEDTWPSRELLSYSTDGRAWSKPVEMFPQGVSTPQRMYFFLAPNGRMLVIAGLRWTHEKTSESTKGGLVVRELRADHSLGDVFTLRPTEEPAMQPTPLYTGCPDKDFVQACRQLLADHVYLQQQDYGKLLDSKDRIKWNSHKAWGEEEKSKDVKSFGKAMCFYERKDGALVGLGKKRWVTLSHDGGKTWEHPTQPESLVTGMGKVWGQRTPDGRYILIYNPHLENRWPLAMLTSDDGLTFRHPQAIHGPLPAKRYDGHAKSVGASYHRGLSKWNNDGSWPDNALWMVYSLNKEDICVARIPWGKAEQK